MNNKRQTIWLVSMLSLMVILSAYYLFTDESGTKAPPVAESTQVDGQKPAAGQGANGTSDELVVNEVIEEGTDGDSGANEQNAESTDTGAQTGSEDPAKAAQGDQGKEGEQGKQGEQEQAGTKDSAEEPKVTETKEGEQAPAETSSTQGAKPNRRCWRK